VTEGKALESKSSSKKSPAAKVLSPRRLRLAALLGVMGPGLIAGLSDDDPAGITTYSQLGAHFAYKLLWVLVFSTLALILFQDLGARIGVVTRQGLIGLVRQKYGARAGLFSVVSLILANIGTMTAEFAGIATAGQLFGLSRYLTVPIAAFLVSFLVLRGTFARVEKVFFVLSAVFLSYLIAGYLSHPNWGAAFKGMVTPSIPLTHDAIYLATATLGTTLAPWGLAFIQSYAVDKRLTRDDLKLLRVDVWTGSLLTGVIGFFVIVTCAATLNAKGITNITDAVQAAKALEPLAGTLAKDLFAIGLIGAALLAASILPLSTAYSVTDLMGRPSALDDKYSEAPLFYGVFAVLTVVSATLILIPGAPLITILIVSQVLNAILLLPLLLYMFGISKDRKLMGEYRATKTMQSVYLFIISVVALCIAAMLWYTVF
jgi:NRAMP (natural resistance-associated macrophage protein)-like metal ion transporter